MAQEQVILQHVTKRFTTRTMGTVTAVDDFNLAIKEGECFSFLGPSGKRKRKKKTGHRFLKEECQLALLSFSKAGAKVRTLKHNFQMFRKFFSFFFSKAEVPKETYGKEEKNGSLPLRFTVRMSKHRRLRSRKRMQK